MQISRYEATKKNAFFSIVCQLTTSFCSLFSRRVFLEKIGIYYLGMTTIFSSIGATLNLFDVGIATSSSYFLYKSRGTNKDKEYSNYFFAFKKLYKYVVLLIIIFGLLACNNIDKFADITLANKKEAMILFVIYLITDCLEMYFSVETLLFSVEQKQYELNIYKTIITIIFEILKIIVMMLFKNFYLYLIINLLFDVCLIIYEKIYIRKNRWIIKNNNDVSNEIKEIFNYAKKSIALNINSFINNSKDSFVIANTYGLVQTGIFSNYLNLTSKVQAFFILLFNSVFASFNDYVNKSESQENLEDFFIRFNEITFIVTSIISIYLIGLTDSFIFLYYGKNYVLDIFTVGLLATNIILTFFQYVAVYYISSVGKIYLETRYAFICTCLNILLSFMLINDFDMKGLFLANCISNLFLLTFMYKLAFIDILKIDRKTLLSLIKYIIKTLLLIITCIFIFRNKATSINEFILRFVVCTLILLFYILANIGIDETKEIVFKFLKPKNEKN